MSQFAFDLPHDALLLEDNFIVSECNKKAHDEVMRWPEWQGHGLLIYGESGCGKTHLGHIWANKVKALKNPQNAGELSGHAFIDNIEKYKPETLLHLLNSAKENSYSLLLTASTSARQLPFTLADLTSRLRALPAIDILSPDDVALKATMRKQFSDRQLMVDDDVINYLTPRMDRAFAKIYQTVEQLDKQALLEGKNITIPFAKRILGY